MKYGAENLTWVLCCLCQFQCSPHSREPRGAIRLLQEVGETHHSHGCLRVLSSVGAGESAQKALHSLTGETARICDFGTKKCCSSMSTIATEMTASKSCAVFTALREIESVAQAYTVPDEVAVIMQEKILPRL